MWSLHNCPTPTVPLLLPHSLCSSPVSSHSTVSSHSIQSQVTVHSLKSQYSVLSHSFKSQSAPLTVWSQYTVCPTHSVSSHSTQTAPLTVNSLPHSLSLKSHSAPLTQSQITVHSLPHLVSSHSTQSAPFSLKSQYTDCPTHSLVTVHSLPHSLSLKLQFAPLTQSQVTVHNLPHLVSSHSTQSAPLSLKSQYTDCPAHSLVTVHSLPHSLTASSHNTQTAQPLCAQFNPVDRSLQVNVTCKIAVPRGGGTGEGGGGGTVMSSFISIRTTKEMMLKCFCPKQK